MLLAQEMPVGAKASTLITHVPDALKNGGEIRDNSMVSRISLGKDGHRGRPGVSLRPPRRWCTHGRFRKRLSMRQVRPYLGCENLFIMDGSGMPTQGSANPGLTIQSLAAAQRITSSPGVVRFCRGKAGSHGFARSQIPLTAGHLSPRRAPPQIIHA